MKQRSEHLTLTLHWRAEGVEHVSTIVCEDGTPAHLIPLLRDGCRLPAHDAGGQPLRYNLHLGAAGGPQLRRDEPGSLQGLRSGDHIWLMQPDEAAGPRCALALPDGDELLLPRFGVAITRPWLLQVLALLNPAAYRRELELLERRASAYRYVSSRPHCSIMPDGRGGWSVSSDRTDLTTLLNGLQLEPRASASLQHGDRIQLGDAGPALRALLLSEAASC
jgi:hypothetical protein